MNEIVAPNVRRIIKQNCLKQAAIAEKAGYTPNQFSAMIKGRKIIKDTDIARMTAALGVDANELFKREGG